MCDIRIGDCVTCTNPIYIGVNGIVIKQYYPTASEQQTMIKTGDGRKFHAPTKDFVKVRIDNA